MWTFKKMTKQYLEKLIYAVGVFEPARRHYIYTFNTTTTVNVTYVAKGISFLKIISS